MISQDYDEYPPMPFLKQIMSPKCLVYLFLWERKDKNNFFDMTWTKIKTYFSKNTFRTNLRNLCYEGLISYEEDDIGVFVELVDWDDIIDE